MKPRTGWRALARYLAGESPAEEATRIREWAESDPAHADILGSARRAWEAAEPEEAEVSVDLAWTRLEQRIEAARGATVHAFPQKRPYWRHPGAWVAMAAAIAALIAIPVVRQQMSGSDSTTFATGPNEQLTVRLADGSVARLAPNSRLRVGRDGAREAWLEGTAFFGIAERKDIAFVVHTAIAEARVLGTRFELRAEAGEVRLAVLEGTVALSGAGGEKLVQAGEVSHAGEDAAPTSPRNADVRQIVGWLGNVLIFQDTPLRDAAAEIQRQYGTTVRIADPALGDRTLTAVFDNRNFEDVIATVCRVVAATCETQESAVIVHP